MRSDNREAMDRIVEVLLEKESMTGDEFRALLAQYAQVRRRSALLFVLLVLSCVPLVGCLHCSASAHCAPGGERCSLAARNLNFHCAHLTAARTLTPPPPHSSLLPPQIPQENLDAVARQKQPDSELQLA